MIKASPGTSKLFKRNFIIRPTETPRPPRGSSYVRSASTPRNPPGNEHAVAVKTEAIRPIRGIRRELYFNCEIPAIIIDQRRLRAAGAFPPHANLISKASPRNGVAPQQTISEHSMPCFNADILTLFNRAYSKFSSPVLDIILITPCPVIICSSRVSVQSCNLKFTVANNPDKPRSIEARAGRRGIPTRPPPSNFQNGIPPPLCISAR